MVGVMNMSAGRDKTSKQTGKQTDRQADRKL